VSDQGVSIPFFCAAIRVLEREHGKKMVGENAEEFRAALARAEAIMKDWPPAEKKRKAKK
jgi:hypothetical protein